MMRQLLLSLGLLSALTASATTYVIDPVEGKDTQSGSESAPWQTWAPLEKVTLRSGDVVKVARPGTLKGSLRPKVTATASNPARIVFAGGEYQWEKSSLATRTLQISNTNDVPNGQKAIAVWLEGVRNLIIEGDGNTFLNMTGKTVMLYMTDCDNITFRNFGLDYLRPTVSEYTVEEVSDTEALIRVHKDSTYRLEGTKLTWLLEPNGEETSNTGSYLQSYDGATGAVWRGGVAINRNATAIEDLGDGLLRVKYTSNPGFKKGYTYQHRITRRDCVGVFCEESSHITYENVGFHFLHGMGVVSQFSRDLTFKNVKLAPREGSGRTCAAWADMLHFSGCGGQITVEGVTFSGANDDAINVHGTHLRLMQAIDNKTVQVRFMHGQTYGFKAFHAGDVVDFVHRDTLVPYATRTIATAELTNERVMTLSFVEPLPQGITYGSDVLENVTWTPAVTVRNCTVSQIPTRGFLFTTRGKVVVDNVQFDRTGMSGILVADDAASWYESGPVRDLTIQNCLFDHCGEPVVNVDPENRNVNAANPVHSGIWILGNTFRLRGGRAIALKSTTDVEIRDNAFQNVASIGGAISQRATSKVTVEDNRLIRAPKTLGLKVGSVTYYNTSDTQNVKAVLLKGSLSEAGAKTIADALKIDNGNTFATVLPGYDAITKQSVKGVSVPPAGLSQPLEILFDNVTLEAGQRYTIVFGDAYWYGAKSKGYLEWTEFTATAQQVAEVEAGTLTLELPAANFHDPERTAPTPLE